MKWRTAVGSGYASPSVSGGRVFVSDFRPTRNNQEIERILCLDEETGKILWKQEWEVDYTGLQLVYGIGPRAAPTVDGNQVYVLGAMGKMLALRAGTGEILWQKDFVRDYGGPSPSGECPVRPWWTGRESLPSPRASRMRK